MCSAIRSAVHVTLAVHFQATTSCSQTDYRGVSGGSVELLQGSYSVGSVYAPAMTKAKELGVSRTARQNRAGRGGVRGQ